MSKTLSIRFYLSTQRARETAACSGFSKITDFCPDSDGRIARDMRGAYTLDELRVLLEDLQRVQSDYDAMSAACTPEQLAVLNATIEACDRAALTSMTRQSLRTLSTGDTRIMRELSERDAPFTGPVARENGWFHPKAYNAVYDALPRETQWELDAGI